MGLDTVVVFSGGPPPGRGVLAAIPPGAAILGADRGAEHALALGLSVSLAVGDFDSIGPAALEALERSGARLEQHPAGKDATDLELTLDAAMALQPERILVVGGASGRLDHRLGELLLLAAPAYAGVEVDALLGRARVHVIRGERRLGGAPGELISLLPLHGEARGVVSEGLVYPLRRRAAPPGDEPRRLEHLRVRAGPDRAAKRGARRRLSRKARLARGAQRRAAQPAGRKRVVMTAAAE